MFDETYGALLDPKGLYRVNDEVIDAPENQGLNLIMGFTGFADAGHVVRQIRAALLEQENAVPLAVFDADQLIDYRSRRPHMTFVEDHLQDFEPPRLALYRLEDPLGTPFLFLTGFEPDLQWERFSRAVVSLVRRLDVNLVTWFHAIPMPVPHTRPVTVTVHGNRPELIEGISAWKPTVEVQAGIGHVLEVRLIQAGRNTAGYVIHVPHYVSEAEYPQAAVAGLEYLGAATSLMLPSEQLRESARDVARQIGEQVQASTDVQEVVTGLEERYDEFTQQQVRRSLLADENDELPSAESIGAAVEAYLAQELDGSANEDPAPAEEAESAQTGTNPDAAEDAAIAAAAAAEDAADKDSAAEDVADDLATMPELKDSASESPAPHAPQSPEPQSQDPDPKDPDRKDADPEDAAPVARSASRSRSRWFNVGRGADRAAERSSEGTANRRERGRGGSGAKPESGDDSNGTNGPDAA